LAVSTRAHHRALHDTSGISEWSKSVPLGSQWVPPSPDPTSLSAPRKTQAKPRPAKKTTKDSDNEKPPFKGDRVLANSIALMRDAMISHEMSYAIAEGDVGRVYEVMKVTVNLYTVNCHTDRYYVKN
jgi:hypothetical protein